MIEVNGVIYRNLEEQVQKNKEDISHLDSKINTTNQNVTNNRESIEEINNKLNNLDLTYATDEDIQNLQSQINTKANQSSLDTTNQNVSQNTSRISSIETNLTQITPDVARALKTPISAPNEMKLVAVDDTNSQEMIGIGEGLVVENNTLKSTGGTEIIDNLTSTNISAALSANQGRILNNSITALQQDKLDKTGGTMDGDIKLKAGKFIVDESGYGLVGYYGTGAATYGNGNRAINLRGNTTRPQYNSRDIAMLSDIPSLRTYQSIVPAGTPIPTNADLNTIEYLKVGNSYNNRSAEVQTFTNCPTQNAFMMTVMRIGTIAEFLNTEKTYIKGKLIRLEGISDDFHIINEIANEIYKGVFI